MPRGKKKAESKGSLDAVETPYSVHTDPKDIYDSLPAEYRPGYDAKKAAFIRGYLNSHNHLLISATELGHDRDAVLKKLISHANDLYGMTVKFNDLPSSLKNIQPQFVINKAPNAEDIKDFVKFKTQPSRDLTKIKETRFNAGVAFAANAEQKNE
jgi:hypothetical protein